MKNFAVCCVFCSQIACNSACIGASTTDNGRGILQSDLAICPSCCFQPPMLIFIGNPISSISALDRRCPKMVRISMASVPQTSFHSCSLLCDVSSFIRCHWISCFICVNLTQIVSREMSSHLWRASAHKMRIWAAPWEMYQKSQPFSWWVCPRCSFDFWFLVIFHLFSFVFLIFHLLPFVSP